MIISTSVDGCALRTNASLKTRPSVSIGSGSAARYAGRPAAKITSFGPEQVRCDTWNSSQPPMTFACAPAIIEQSSFGFAGTRHPECAPLAVGFSMYLVGRQTKPARVCTFSIPRPRMQIAPRSVTPGHQREISIALASRIVYCNSNRSPSDLLFVRESHPQGSALTTS